MTEQNTDSGACPKWGDLGHNWLQGGEVWWRDWFRLRPWRRFRVCVGCFMEQYDNGKVRKPAQIDGSGVDR